MTDVELRPYGVNINVWAGGPVTLQFTASNTDGPVSLDVNDVVAQVLSTAGVEVAAWAKAVSGVDSEILTLTLTPAATLALAAVLTGPARVAVSVDDHPWVGGYIWVHPVGAASASSSFTQEFAVSTGNSLDLAVTVLGSVGGSGAATLGGLDDVTITTPISGNVVSYDGTGWVNSTPAGGGDLLAANNLSDVDDAATAAANLGLGTAAFEAATAFATGAEGDLAATAVQPGDLGAVATSNAYGDLSGLPTLGTAAATDASDYATAAQGTLADSATQPGDLATVATTGAYSDLSGKPTLGTAAAAATHGLRYRRRR